MDIINNNHSKLIYCTHKINTTFSPTQFIFSQITIETMPRRDVENKKLIQYISVQ